MYSFGQHLLSAHFMPGALLGTEDTKIFLTWHIYSHPPTTLPLSL